MFLFLSFFRSVFLFSPFSPFLLTPRRVSRVADETPPLEIAARNYCPVDYRGALKSISHRSVRWPRFAVINPINDLFIPPSNRPLLWTILRPEYIRASLTALRVPLSAFVLAFVYRIRVFHRRGSTEIVSSSGRKKLGALNRRPSRRRHRSINVSQLPEPLYPISRWNESRRTEARPRIRLRFGERAGTDTALSSNASASSKCSSQTRTS